LLEQLVQQANPKIFLWMRDADVPWLCRVDKYVVDTFGASQHPAICFHLIDQVFVANGDCYNHQKGA